MKLFKAFCSGKSILLSDSQKLSRYIYLCKTTPISYQAIQQSVGYINILNAQFNQQQFNAQLFPEFIQLISRDFKEISQQEYNFYLQAISNYIETSFVNNDFNQQQFDQVVDQILKEGTYIQQALFYCHYYGYFYFKIAQKTNIKQLFSELSTAIPSNTEEKLWKLAVIIEQDRQDKKQPNVQIFDEMVQNLELFYTELSNFKNVSTKMLLFRLTGTINMYYLRKLSQIDNQILQSLILIQKMCQTDLDQNLSLLNSYQLYIYMGILASDENLLKTVSLDLVYNEILQRDLQKVPINDQIVFLIIMINVQQLNKPVIQYLVESLYKNIDYISIGYYPQVFEILHITKKMVDCFDKFLTKLQLKVNPKLLPLKSVAQIMIVLTNSNRMDEAVLEKYLGGIKDRIKDIDPDCAFEILYSINSLRLPNFPIFQKIKSLKFPNDQKIPLQLEMLRYYQHFDHKNNRTQQIQQNFLKFIQKEYSNDLMTMFVQTLVSYQPNKVITVIPELKEYVKRYQKENENTQEGAKEINEILRIEYGIE